jgi:hypothetical protein
MNSDHAGPEWASYIASEGVAALGAIGRRSSSDVFEE